MRKKKKSFREKREEFSFMINKANSREKSSVSSLYASLLFSSDWQRVNTNTKKKKKKEEGKTEKKNKEGKSRKKQKREKRRGKKEEAKRKKKGIEEKKIEQENE